VLRDLGVTRVRLLTNNPEKAEALADFGITVDARVPLTPHPNPHNLRYLRTKRDRMGHQIPDLPGDGAAQPGRDDQHGVAR
jgi:3,4-dihydroxy 2-butanone 4-phosphate synthase/GTP cyclohydrolase II